MVSLLAQVVRACGQFFLQCLAFLDMLNEHPASGNARSNQPRWLAAGTLTLHSRADVLDPSGSNQRVFIAMVRSDIARALNISMDYVSVTQVRAHKMYVNISRAWFINYGVRSCFIRHKHSGRRRSACRGEMRG